MKRYVTTLIAIVFGLGLLVGTAMATQIFYESFESPPHADVAAAVSGSSGGWVKAGQYAAGLHDEVSGKFTTPWGEQAAFAHDHENTKGTTFTTSTNLTNTVQAFVMYNLTFNVASENGSSNPGYGVDLLAGGSVIDTVTGKPTSSDMSANSDSISFLPAPGDPHIGQQLAIRLRKPVGSWNGAYILYDNISLTATDTSGDTDAPTPNPLTWVQVPTPAANNSIMMMATNAADPNMVEYLFSNTVNHVTSGWQDGRTWTDTGLTDGVTYTYKVKARDKSANQNETAWSSAETATASEKIVFYETFEAPPFTDVTGRTLGLSEQGWVINYNAGLTDEAQGRITTPFGDQGSIIYDNGGASSSSYTTSTNLTNTLQVSATYVLTFNTASENGGGAGYGVDLMAGSTVLDTVSGNPNNSDVSVTSNSISFTTPPGHANLGEQLAIRLRKPTGSWNGGDIVYDNIRLTAEVLGDSTAPTPDPMGWYVEPWPAADGSIAMIASNATDVAGVQYFFTNTISGQTSGWIDSYVWTNTGLSDGVSYTYKVKARDLSASLNETAWSPERSATADETIVLYESFELPIISGRVAFSCPGWYQNSSAQLNEDHGTAGASTPYGTQMAHLGYQGSPTGKRIETTSLTDVLTAGTEYTVSFNVGNVRESDGTTRANNEYTAELVSGSTVVGSLSALTSTKDMSETGSFSFTPDSSNPALGETLKLRLYHSGGDWQWQPLFDNIKFTADPDETPPTPDPVGFATAPFGINATSIVMTAATATDVTGPVEYLFTNDTAGVASAWQTNTFWRNNGLTGSTSYDYRVRARDAAGNMTTWSSVSTASSTNETTPPSPDPMSFAVVPSSVDSSTIAMSATTASDVWNNPVEYYFLNTTNSNNSGWTTNTSWSDTGLAAGVTYGYTVKARDAVGNETAESPESTAAPAGDTTPPNPDPMGFEVLPAAIDPYTITMTASNATDFSEPVEYYFLNTNNSVNSGWITGRVWTNGSLTAGETYGFKVKARDAVSNATAYSAVATAAAVAPAVTIFSEDFENPPHADVAGSAITTGNSQGWLASGTAGLLDEDSGYYVTADGTQAGALGSSGTFTTSTNLTDTLEESLQYDLTFNVASKQGASGTYRVDLMAGGSTLDYVGGTVASSNMSDTSDSISFTAAPNDPNLTDTLAIKLACSSGEIYFDSIELTTTHTGGDSTAPSPDPVTWLVVPETASSIGSTMVANEATDARWVQYLFSNTVSGATSGWKDEPWWGETGLTDGVTYGYRVKARDNSVNLNETDWSVVGNVTASDDVIFYESFEAPPHDDVVAAVGKSPSQGWIKSNLPGGSGGSAGLHDEVSGQFTTPYGAQAAWIYDNSGTMKTIYTTTTDNLDATLTASTTYTLTFNAASESRNGGGAGYGVYLVAGTNVLESATGTPGSSDMSFTNAIVFTPGPSHPNLGETLAIRLRKPTGGWSGPYAVFDNIKLTAVVVEDNDAPTPDPMGWTEGPVAAAYDSIFMVATNATDAAGVQYYFLNTVNGNNSGWQDSRFWADSNLTTGVTYSYKVKARDNSSNLNETDWSSTESAQVVPYTVFYEGFERPIGETTGWIFSSAWLRNEVDGVISTPYGAQVVDVGYTGGPTGRRAETTGITEVLEDRHAYTLTFAAGNVHDYVGVQYTAELLAGSTVLTNVIAETSTDDMTETGSVTFSTTVGHANNGETLALRFYHSDGGQWQSTAVFDNIRLTAEPLPDPPSMFLFR